MLLNTAMLSAHQPTDELHQEWLDGRDDGGNGPGPVSCGVPLAASPRKKGDEVCSCAFNPLRGSRSMGRSLFNLGEHPVFHRARIHACSKSRSLADAFSNVDVDSILPAEAYERPCESV